MKIKSKDGKFFIIALGTGNTLTPVYNELVRRHREEGLSFKNMVVFNGYEYYPLTAKSTTTSLSQLHERFLDLVDIDRQNIFSPDGTIQQDAVQEYCRLYEQRIQTFGGLDAALFASEGLVTSP
jgi:glucosamine-6-phosphate deaminase